MSSKICSSHSEDIEKLRILNSFFRHDLRSKLGSSRLTLEIILAENLIQDNELKELIQQSIEASKDLIEESDELSDRCQEETLFIWVDSTLEKSKILNSCPHFVRSFACLESFRSFRKLYRPDLLFMSECFLKDLSSKEIYELSLSQSKGVIFADHLKDDQIKAITTQGLKIESSDLEAEVLFERIKVAKA